MVESKQAVKEVREELKRLKEENRRMAKENTLLIDLANRDKEHFNYRKEQSNDDFEYEL